MNERLIFENALQKRTVAERLAYLEDACQGDVKLRNNVEELLAEQADLGSFLESPSPGLEVTTDTTVTSEAIGDQIGPYKLREQIGDGGFGIVFAAEQENPVRRKVALKIIKPGMDSKEVIARFEAERQALALMDHPNIARVLDAGTTRSGRPYFVMELVRGIPITEYCDSRCLPTRLRLELFVATCNALQHAHQKGVIHRDVKPSNVLVTEHDGTPLVKVIDFGVAKAINQRLTAHTVYTRHQQMVGTPLYMSPEQAELSALDVDTRSDIYSLGVLLYELLTGTTPVDRKRFCEAAFDEMRRIIREEDPPKPSTRLSTLGDDAASISQHRNTDLHKLKHILQGDLDWIVMKCLEKDRTRRYETANGLALDIKRHVDDEPVTARPPSRLYRFQKVVRKNRLTFLAIGAVTASLVVGIAISSLQAIRAVRAEEQAVAARKKEVEQRHMAELARMEAEAAQLREKRLKEQAYDEKLLARKRAYASDMVLAQRALENNNFGQARRLMNRQRPRDGEVDLRGWEWRLLWQMCQGDVLMKLGKHSDSVTTMAFSRDGSLLATGDWGGSITLCDAGTGRKIASLSAQGTLRGLAFLEDGKVLASGAGKEVVFWAVETGKRLTAVRLDEGRLRSFAMSPTGTSFATLASRREAKIWDSQTKKVLATFPVLSTYGDHPGTLSYSQDGTTLCIGDLDGSVRLVDVVTHEVRCEFSAHDMGITALAFSPDGKLLTTAAGYASSPIKMWDTSTGECVAKFIGHSEWVSSLQFSSDGSQLVSASADQTVRVWDVQTKKAVATLRGHELEVWCVAYSPDGRSLVSGCKDGAVNLWNARIGDRTRDYVTTSVPLDDVRFTKNAESMIVLKNDGTIALWDATELREIVPLSDLGSDNVSIAISPDDRWCIAGTQNGVVRVWDLLLDRLTTDLPGHERGAFAVFSPRGETMVTADGSGQVLFWDVETWQEVRRWQSDAGWSAVAPNGRTVAKRPGPGEFEIWDVETNTRIGGVRAHRRGGHLAFSPSSQLIASVSADGSMGVWHTTTLERKLAPTGHIKGVHSVKFFPDGTRLVTGSGDQETVRLWDAETGEEVATLVGEGYLIYKLQISPDGSTIAAINGDGKIHLWRPPSWDDIDRAESIDNQ